ncbi:hypothetical protein GCM10028783_36910 [Modestobacter muralis]
MSCGQVPGGSGSRLLLFPDTVHPGHPLEAHATDGTGNQEPAHDRGPDLPPD